MRLWPKMLRFGRGDACNALSDFRPKKGRDPKHQIRSLVLCVDLVGSRRIWPAHVARLVDLVGSRRIPSDRLDDQRDDHVPSDRETDGTLVGLLP
jgi:hypothetical protein